MTDAPRQFASPDQLSEKDRFLHIFGKALAAWAETEYMLSLWFAACAGIEPDRAQAIFFSGRSFQARSGLLAAALETSEIAPEWGHVVQEAITRTTSYSFTRNRLAHGIMHPDGRDELDGLTDWKIKEPAEWQTRVGLSYQTIKLIAENFQRLSAALRDSFVRHAMREPPTESLRLLLELPGAADSTQPNRKQTVQLRQLPPSQASQPASRGFRLPDKEEQ